MVTISNIQHFSVGDGPGIRTIVFFKGCLMRCAWCCNPESQSCEIEEMSEKGKIKTVGYDVTVDDIMPELLSDVTYYRRSGGGITLSGGEFLLQVDFAEALLSRCKSEGLHAAVESTANLPFDVIQRVLPYIDLFLLDIKHTDSEKHREYTGHKNERIMENARLIAESGTELIVRTPVIPGFNDTDKEIREIARFAKGLPGVKEHHLLPYHRLGSDKYSGLGRSYAMQGVEPPEKARMEYLRSVSEETGLIAKIGG